MPRILDTLESGCGCWPFTRHAWEVLVYVFTEEAAVIPDYNPKASQDECRATVATLRDSLEHTPDGPRVSGESCRATLTAIKQVVGLLPVEPSGE